MSYRSVLFLHIPKTGGTTLRSVISRQYPQGGSYEIVNPINESIIEFRESSAASRLQYSLLQGHMSYGLHEFMSDDFSYVTMLREPLRRAVSDYAFVSTNTLHPLYESVQSMSFSDYLNSGMTSQLENGQTRLIAGDCEPGNIGIPTVNPMTDDDLLRATDHISRHFSVVGVLERFDESLLLMRQALGWKLPFYVKQNITAKGAKPRLNTEDLETARRQNNLDLKLYQASLDNLDQQIAAGGDQFQNSLARFRLLNKAWSASHSLSKSELRPRLGRLRRAVMKRF